MANRERALGIGLGFTAGFVDTVGFIGLFGLFTAHVTGNFVLIGSELQRPSNGVLIKFLAFPAFIAGVVLARMLVLWLERAGRAPLRYLLAAQAFLLMVFMLLGQAALPMLDPQAWPVLLAGITGAAAMGVQNAASRLCLSALAPTTVMTGNVTQLVIDLVDVLRGAADAGVRERIAKFWWPILAFALGAVGGGFAHAYWQFLALLLPVLLLAGFAVVGQGQR